MCVRKRERKRDGESRIMMCEMYSFASKCACGERERKNETDFRVAQFHRDADSCDCWSITFTGCFYMRLVKAHTTVIL